MLNRNYKNGANKERKLVNREREKGRLSFRSAGSHSPIDVFSLDKQGVIKLIQSKPKTMSENAKQKILDNLKQYEGFYEVVCVVE